MQSQATIFRDEALEQHLGGNPTHGDLLRVSPRWARWSFWLMVAVFVAGSIYAGFGRVNEYATGVAVIRDQRRASVTAITGGTIVNIAARAGQRVQANQLLLRFNDVQERIELERLHRELDLEQINRLKNPNDSTSQQQLANIRVQIEVAEKRLNERGVFAPCDGIVRDIRIRPQQLVAAGELLLTIANDDDAMSVIVILPGHYRPLLRPGDPLRLQLNGFRYAYQPLIIRSVGDEVVGPSEIRRFLGQEIADSLVLQGSSVIVHAQLPSRQFKAAGRWQEYHDGMHGMAEALVRSESVVVTLVPGLKAVLEGREEAR